MGVPGPVRAGEPVVLGRGGTGQLRRAEAPTPDAAEKHVTAALEGHSVPMVTRDLPHLGAGGPPPTGDRASRSGWHGDTEPFPGP